MRCDVNKRSCVCAYPLRYVFTGKYITFIFMYNFCPSNNGGIFIIYIYLFFLWTTLCYQIDKIGAIDNTMCTHQRLIPDCCCLLSLLTSPITAPPGRWQKTELDHFSYIHTQNNILSLLTHSLFSFLFSICNHCIALRQPTPIYPYVHNNFNALGLV